MREKLSTHIFSGLCAEELTIRDLMLSPAWLCYLWLCSTEPISASQVLLFSGKVRLAVGIWA